MDRIVQEFLDLTNFQRAWQKVAENRGCAGVDSETIEDFAKNQSTNISQLRDAVANSTYQALPCKQILIRKNKESWRELKIPTVRDRIVQQALLNVLYPLVDSKFSSASFAYRPNLSYLNAVEKVAEWRDRGYHWVLDADLVAFFDNIDHQRLLKEIRQHIENPGILCLIKSWISVGSLTKQGLVLPEKGIPQGAVISPILANIYLDEFDRIISASDLKIVRYADDFIILSQSKERILKAYTEVADIVSCLGLEMHRQKTRITNFQRGFRFLGHGFLENAIFPVNPPQENIQNLSDRGEVSKKKLPQVGKKPKKKQLQR